MEIKVFNHIFRTYDIRGIVGPEVDENLAFLIGKAFGSYIKNNNKHTVAISGDVRPSTSSLISKLQEGLLSTGANVIDIGVLPTPLNYYSNYDSNLDIDASIQITGSHNPSEYNGFKITFDKKPFFGDDIQLLYKMIINEEFRLGEGKLSQYDIKSDYMRMVQSKIDINKRIKVAIDCGNAAGCVVAPELYKLFNIELLELYCDIDGNFPNHHPDPTVDSNLSDLQEFTVANGCDLGIAFDGDADRIVALDQDGGIIRSDILMSLFLPTLITDNDSIVYDVKCSKALEDMIVKYKGNPVMWKTGHSLIKNKMKEMGAKLGGEMSGHIFFADNYYGFDDAIYVGLRLIELLSNSNRSIKDLVEEVPLYYSTPEIRLDCKDDDEKNDIMEKAFNYFSSKFDYSDVDVIRLKLDDGWALIRSSNTQPVIVCRMEASSKNRLDEYKSMVLDKLFGWGVVENE